jgi:hypothetical protein
MAAPMWMRCMSQRILVVEDDDQITEEENQQRVDTIVGGQMAAARVRAEVFDTWRHILTCSSNLGPRHLPLPAPTATLVHAAPRLSTRAMPGGVQPFGSC